MSLGLRLHIRAQITHKKSKMFSQSMPSSSTGKLAPERETTERESSSNFATAAACGPSLPVFGDWF